MIVSSQLVCDYFKGSGLTSKFGFLMMDGNYLTILSHISTYLKALSFKLFNVQIKIQLISTHKLVRLV